MKQLFHDIVNGITSFKPLHRENIVWYIEATSPNQTKTPQGSGIAVKIQKKGYPATTSTCLLTCAHVVRQDDGYGPAYPDIFAWAPHSGHTEGQRKKLEILKTIIPYESFNENLPVPDDYVNSVASDWVLLCFQDADSRNTREVAADFSAHPAPKLELYGFPGGSNLIENHKGIVKSVKMPGVISYRNTSHGCLRLTSTQGAPGVSGGGVFNKRTSELVGIHRSKKHDVLALHAISIEHIRQKIEEQGYQLLEKSEDEAKLRESNLPTKLLKYLMLLITVGVVSLFFYAPCQINAYFSSSSYSMNMENKQYLAAKSIADNLVKECPSDSFGYQLQGDVAFKTGNFETAVSSFKNALDKLKNAPENFKNTLRVNLGDSYIENHEPDKGLAIYRNIDSTDSGILEKKNYKIGRALFHLDMNSEAITSLNKVSLGAVTEGGLGGSRAKVYLAAAKLNIGDRRGAIRSLNDALEFKGPEWCQILQNKRRDPNEGHKKLIQTLKAINTEIHAICT